MTAHVLAAAIKCKADVKLSFNQKDFPADYLQTFQIRAIHTDEFIDYQIDMAPAIYCAAFRNQRNALNKPPMAVCEFLTGLQKQQLQQTVSLLKQHSGFI